MKLILDTETTGLNRYRNDEAVQIAYFLFDEKKFEVVDVDSFYLYTNLSIGKSCSDVTGITKEFLSKHVFADYRDKLRKVADYMSKYQVVGHNISFDIQIMNNTFKANRIDFWMNDAYTIDTMILFMNIVKSTNKLGKIKYPRLEEVVNYIDKNEVVSADEKFKKSFGDSRYHDALYDSFCTLLAYIYYINRCQ